MISGKVASNQITDGEVIKTVDAGETITAHVAGGEVSFNNGAKVIQANVQASNGIIHVIDQVRASGVQGLGGG